MADRQQEGYPRQALPWLGSILLVVALALLLWFGGRVLLLGFAGILMAVVLRAPVGALRRRTGMPDRLAYALVLVMLVGLLALFGLLAGPPVLEQAGEFGRQLPQFAQSAQQWLEDRTWGQWVLEQFGAGSGGDQGGESDEGGAAGGEGDSGSEGGDASGVADGVTRALRAIATTLGHLVFVLVLALFLGLNPDMYRRGVVRLFPAKRQQRAAEVIDEMGETLRHWLLGQLALMVLTGTLTGVGLAILGIPLALALGVFVGLMEFIPLVGPILGFIPIVLMASTEGMTALISVTVLYLVIQQIEGNILTPLVQQRAVDLPPALTLTAVFLGGTLFGPLGVILGTPLMAVLFVLVKMLYVHDVLGQTVQVPGHEETASRS